MRLKIIHTTRYEFDAPVPYGLQQLRKTPKSYRAQNIINWQTTVTGGIKELEFEDQHRNTVDLISFATGTTELVIRNEGEVELTDTHGVVGPHEGAVPLWLFDRQTPLTRPGKGVRELIKQVGGDTELDRLHTLSAVIGAAVTYDKGKTETGCTAEEAIELGHGVCQDHAHVFIACARQMGFPARYVSGYLMMDDTVEQDAMHAWVEAYVSALGWVGFDVSNGMSPDRRYVRVATGLDYSEAAPVRGTTLGGAGENLTVSVQVAQQ
ncbi:transglutaminase family protein [Mesobacterium sp. TK19101]|uniref:Transglutaminase family protein n=1 Tax=Mesobacterium hydrothermale TaxID=3111907 RepID=A0ABU6HF36_9RHOB|nr:transglutaminase family protein [Mesobacterium sp. TK19101]MEC3861079.1 transglutaminase family protein [Mesobacterium sp. TK19101]